MGNDLKGNPHFCDAITPLDLWAFFSAETKVQNQPNHTHAKNLATPTMADPPPHFDVDSATSHPSCRRTLDFGACPDEGYESSTESEVSSSKIQQNKPHVDGVTVASPSSQYTDEIVDDGIATCPSNEYTAEMVHSPSNNHQVPAPCDVQPSCATPQVKRSVVTSQSSDLALQRASRKSDGSRLAVQNSADRQRIQLITRSLPLEQTMKFLRNGRMSEIRDLYKDGFPEDLGQSVTGTMTGAMNNWHDEKPFSLNPFSELRSVLSNGEVALTMECRRLWLEDFMLLEPEKHNSM